MAKRDPLSERSPSSPRVFLHPLAYVLRTETEVTFALTVVDQLDESNSITLGPENGDALCVGLEGLRADAGFFVDGRLELKARI